MLSKVSFNVISSLSFKCWFYAAHIVTFKMSQALLHLFIWFYPFDSVVRLNILWQCVCCTLRSKLLILKLSWELSRFIKLKSQSEIHHLVILIRVKETSMFFIIGKNPFWTVKQMMCVYSTLCVCLCVYSCVICALLLVSVLSTLIITITCWNGIYIKSLTSKNMQNVQNILPLKQTLFILKI